MCLFNKMKLGCLFLMVENYCNAYSNCRGLVIVNIQFRFLPMPTTTSDFKLENDKENAFTYLEPIRILRKISRYIMRRCKHCFQKRSA